MNRHHDQDNFIKTTSNCGWLTGSEVQSIITKVKTWQHSGRHGSGGAESSTSSSESHYWKTGSQAARMRVLKPTPTVTHLLKQGHTHSNRATPPNSATPWAESIHKPMANLIYYYTLYCYYTYVVYKNVYMYKYTVMVYICLAQGVALFRGVALLE